MCDGVLKERNREDRNRKGCMYVTGKEGLSEGSSQVRRELEVEAAQARRTGSSDAVSVF